MLHCPKIKKINEGRCVFVAQRLGAEHAGAISRESKKSLGQFMTPPEMADYMVKGLAQNLSKKSIKILEPAAGAGVLVAAFIDYILQRNIQPLKIELVMYEIDVALVGKLKILSRILREKLNSRNIEFYCSIRGKDFLLDDNFEKFDFIISNPPYFKIRKDDVRARKYADVVHGQPNIYGLFMERCSELLVHGGRFCFLTPRSWTSGTYFTALRKSLFSKLKFDAIHLFESRESHFPNSRIQQEAMITWGTTREVGCNEILISVSDGLKDIHAPRLKLISSDEIFPTDNDSSLIFSDQKSCLLTGIFTHRLSSFGLKACTGKVVPFRVKEFLRDVDVPESVPLIWMQHVHHLKVVWPILKKCEHFLASDASKKFLVRKGNYVLVRRFSPRDGGRYIISAPLVDVEYDFIGIENHINYIQKIDGELTREETFGLAWYLGSQYVNDYFYVRLGHTQINAADLNSLPIPPMELIFAIGKILLEKGWNEESDSEIHDLLTVAFKTHFALKEAENV